MHAGPCCSRRATLARWQARVSAVSHTHPDHSPFSLQRPVCWGPPTVPRSRFFFCLFLVLDRHDYRVTACVHRCNTGRTRPRFVARLARSDSPQSRGPCPRADLPSPRPSRSASEVARSLRRGVPHAPYVFARTPAPIYCYLLLLLGLLPYFLPSNRLIILVLYSYHYTYHVLFVITIRLMVAGYKLQKHVVYVYTAPNTSIRTCLLYTSPSPRDKRQSRMPSSA